ncbi:16S rRNA (cytidine(1402)-2'-O)-methyltransferase [Marinicella gelatinilytica]|uniref:16S rRNA (cytidine(1402)-2'-O)-methyltransferase n=1 Tax=Marinicella gelatinilytica TaxID=2996017 RepID=UPI00226092E1|nr:16S rRNA (cytidine(1402)-2'-O)-methyltransferase [Marinicella gelatinilytica]MCX7544067.1 16S rRNA (cytidine(1402)-2'-O)-methyltransferase [Marinicella gelatinilytica]
MTDTNLKDSGILYVVATPIGHLDDISYRAVEVLKNCDLILCEDTRHSKRLLQNYNITTATRSLHAHNEHHISASILAQIKQGSHMALISDAGTPLISDPGFPLIEQAHQQGIKVMPIPGASAVIALLSVAGLPVQPFTFHGFIPPKKNQRLAFYQSLLPLNQTHVFYESSHRIAKSLVDLSTILDSEARVCVGRELTKRFEHIYSGNAEEVSQQIQESTNHQKGEFVIAVSGRISSATLTLNDDTQKLALLLKPLMAPKQAASVVAEHHGANKKQVYEFIINSSND